MGMEGLYHYLNNEHNKAFKRDLARVAFSVCVGFSD